jgi:O-antigen/teichoic acid export membrane protein
LILTLAAYLLPSAMAALVSLLLIVIRSRHSCPFDVRRLFALYKRAAGFFFLSISAAFVLQVDYLVISQFLSPQMVAAYAVIAKIFAFVFVLYNAALQSIWPICAEKIVRHEWNVVRQLIVSYLALGFFLVCVFTGVIIWKGQLITAILAPNTGIIISPTLAFSFGFYYLIRIWADTLAMVLQSMNKLLSLWIAVPVQGFLSASLQWYLVPRYEILGVIAALVLSFLLTVAWVFPAIIAHEFRINQHYQSME